MLQMYSLMPDRPILLKGYKHLADEDAPRHVHVGHARSALDQHKRQLLPSKLHSQPLQCMSSLYNTIRTLECTTRTGTCPTKRLQMYSSVPDRPILLKGYMYLPHKDAPRHVHIGHARSALDQHKRQLLAPLFAFIYTYIYISKYICLYMYM